MYYTIGQRKGLGIGGGHSNLSSPWYVVGKDMIKNNLIVCQGKENPSLYSKRIIASNLHCISNLKLDTIKKLTAKIRYRQKDQLCNIEMLNNNSAVVTFQKPVFAAAPGQSIVFYNADVCLGGGIIEPYVN
jgi:tRNA-specific 2-thiouridylase